MVPQTQRRTITGPQTITLPSVTDVALEAFDRAFGQLVMYGEAEGVIALESSSVASGQMFMYGEVEESSQDAVDGASGRITFNLEEQLDDMEQVAWDLFIEKKDNRLLAALRRARR